MRARASCSEARVLGWRASAFGVDGDERGSSSAKKPRDATAAHDDNAYLTHIDTSQSNTKSAGCQPPDPSAPHPSSCLLRRKHHAHPRRPPPHTKQSLPPSRPPRRRPPRCRPPPGRQVRLVARKCIPSDACIGSTLVESPRALERTTPLPPISLRLPLSPRARPQPPVPSQTTPQLTWLYICSSRTLTSLPLPNTTRNTQPRPS